MFPWKPAISYVFSKRTAHSDAARSRKFIGKFLPIIVLPWRKWPPAISADGLERLDRLSCIKEGQSNYLDHAAADFIRLTHQGRDLDRCLAVSFSWEENHRITDSIRKGLKECGALPREGMRLEMHESLRWTTQQKRDWQRYEPGQVVTFAPARNRPAPSRDGRAR